jgi:signal peptidase I
MPGGPTRSPGSAGDPAPSRLPGTEGPALPPEHAWADGAASGPATGRGAVPGGRTRGAAPPTEQDALGRLNGQTGSKRGDTRQRRFGFLRELPVLLVLAFLLALLIKTFVVQAFYIPSQSMEPTLEIGDRVLVNKVVYRLHPPGRGDVIVFEDPNPVAQPDRSPLSSVWHWLIEGLGVSASAERDFIKRVIGLPGDVVEIDPDGAVHVNGVELREPYLSPVQDQRPYGPVTVPRDSLFVMGDNRPNSNDSRFSLGMIPQDRVIGRAFVVIWPPSRVGWLR